ncbi:MAG: TolC family protein, partial [Gammaproteobacteria bacterium]|nr:TolC family protein [Gammaproteobacteria bacterium]
LIADSRAALKQSRAVEQDAAQTPKIALEYQRTLLNTQRTFWDLRQKLILAKTELATLMNLKPGTSFSLSTPNSEASSIPELDISLDELERQALMHRPELMEQDYRLRISQKEVKKALLRMLPGLELKLGAHYDDNKYLHNNHWADTGMSLTWNLLNLIRGPSVKAAAEADVELQKTRSLAKGMAVLTQVHLAHQRLQIAKDSFTIADQLNDVNQRLLKQAQAGASTKTGSELDLIRARATTLVTHMRRDLAYAELQNAYGRINHTIGKDPLPKSVAAHDIPTLSQAIATQLESN